MAIQSHSCVIPATESRRVDLQGGTVTGEAGVGGTFAALFEIRSAGGEWGAINDGAASFRHTWLILGAAADFEVRLTVTSGTFATGTTGAWLPMSSNRAWTLAAGVGAASAVGTLEIRNALTGAILDSATLTLARVA